MTSPIIDSHCHLNLLHATPDFSLTLDEVLNEAKAVDVAHVVCVSCELKTFPEVLRIAKQYPMVSASVGLHPTEVADHEPQSADLVRLGQDDAVIAVGETGLDYYRSEGDLSWQRERFVNHISAAKTLGKPLIVHSRAAREDTLVLLKEEHAEEVGGVFHCFTEDLEMALYAIDLNFYISFSGIITFQNAKALREVAREVPLERILIETDAPYLAPVPHRGQVNRPAYVRYVAQCLADLKEVSYDCVAKETTANFYRCFKGVA